MLVDTSVLLAAADNADPDHASCVEAITGKSPLVTTPLVVAETAYLIGRQLGPAAEAAVFRAIAAGELQLEMVTPADAERIAELIETYADLGLGGTDASLIAIAERRQITGSPRSTGVTSRLCAQATRLHSSWSLDRLGSVRMSRSELARAAAMVEAFLRSACAGRVPRPDPARDQGAREHDHDRRTPAALVIGVRARVDHPADRSDPLRPPRLKITPGGGPA